MKSSKVGFYKEKNIVKENKEYSLFNMKIFNCLSCTCTRVSKTQRKKKNGQKTKAPLFKELKQGFGRQGIRFNDKAEMDDVTQNPNGHLPLETCGSSTSYQKSTLITYHVNPPTSISQLALCV